MESWTLVGQIVLLLGAALVAGAAMARLKQSPMLGYILAGMFLGGPGSVRLVDTDAQIAVIAEIGVSLLLFSIGLEFAWVRLKALGGRALLGGAAQVVVTLLVAAGVAHVLGLAVREAVAVGAMVSLSSTAAVLRLLLDGGESDSPHGRNCLAILLVQDIAIVPLAILLTLLSAESIGIELVWDVGRLVLLAVVLVVTLYLVLNKVAIRALGALALERTRELAVLLAVVVGLGSTWAAHAAGLSPALGAFLAGMFLGGSPFATQVRADVSSLRIVLVTLFFASAGMVADPVWIAHNALTVAWVTALVLVGKVVVLFLVLRAAAKTTSVALATGLCLCQVGEFAFVLGGVATAQGVVSDETYALVVSVAIVSLIATPFLVSTAPRAATWLEARTRRVGTAPAADGDGHAAPDALVVGFGPAGEWAGRAFHQAGIACRVVDLNPEALRRAGEIGLDALVGDATHADVLEHAGARTAKWVAITLPSRSSALIALAHARALNPRAHVIVRTRYRLHRAEFERAGAHAVVDDEDEAGKGLRDLIRGATGTRAEGPAVPGE